MSYYKQINQKLIKYKPVCMSRMASLQSCPLPVGAAVPAFHKQYWMEFLLLVVTAKVREVDT